MASNTATLEHKVTGQRKQAPIGFSWTTFLFGPFPALFRGDLKWAAGMFIAAVVASIVFFPLVFIVWIGFGAVYNKNYAQGLIQQGYQIVSVQRGTPEQVAHELSVNPDSATAASGQ
jgi:hypothetical protein